MKNWLNFFSSMKLGLALLAVFGIYAAAGSVLKPETYMHTPLFAFLGTLVTANMLVCTGRQLLQLGRGIRHNAKGGSTGPILRKASVTFLHLGILLVLVGVLISGRKEMARFGMYVGDSVNLQDVSRHGPNETLSFTDFDLELDDAGRIVQYRAQVCLEGKNTLLQINRPLRAGRGRLLFGEYIDSVTVQIWEKGEAAEAKIGGGDSIPFRDRTYRAVLLRYVPDYTESDWMFSTVHRGENPRLVFNMSDGEEEMSLYVAKFGDMIPLGDDCRFRFTETEPYVVFAYAYDPGSIPVTVGAVLTLMSLGIWMLLKERNAKQTG